MHGTHLNQIITCEPAAGAGVVGSPIPIHGAAKPRPSSWCAWTRICPMAIRSSHLGGWCESSRVGSPHPETSVDREASEPELAIRSSHLGGQL